MKALVEYKGDWWRPDMDAASAGEKRWHSILDVCPEVEKLGRLHLIEERLTAEQWAQYSHAADRFGWGLAIHYWWEAFKQDAHASAEQKIKALASVLRGATDV
jgi:hypothetical protein